MKIILDSRTITKYSGATISLDHGLHPGVTVLDRMPSRTYNVVLPTRPNGDHLEQLRRFGSNTIDLMMLDRCPSARIVAPKFSQEEVLAFIEGMVLADYSFDRYKSKAPFHIDYVRVQRGCISAEALQAKQLLWNRIFWCREWVNTPVADLNAPQFADELDTIAHDLKHVTCTVFDKKKIEALRLNGLLAVNKGSVDEPRFAVLEYNPPYAKNNAPIALVGKGIMYDTGGLNIKPDHYMEEMKSDMAGAATMASVLFAAADLELPIHLVAFLPMTDSRPGFNAYAADDIITMYDGTTVEVVNTDAEGRIILADAIAYAVANHSPQLLIDAATLTGAAVRAIGTFGIAAVQQNAQRPFRKLCEVGDKVYERLAELPFWPEYDGLIKSEMADIRNSGSAQAGTITAGKFLAHFAKNTPFIHLDIAGVAYFSKRQDYFRTGASGYGIRLLIEYLKSL